MPYRGWQKIVRSNSNFLPPSFEEPLPKNMARRKVNAVWPSIAAGTMLLFGRNIKPQTQTEVNRHGEIEQDRLRTCQSTSERAKICMGRKGRVERAPAFHTTGE